MLQVLLGFDVHSHNFVERFMKMNPGNDVRKYVLRKIHMTAKCIVQIIQNPFLVKKDSKKEVQGKPDLTSRLFSKKQPKRLYHYKLTSSPK